MIRNNARVCGAAVILLLVVLVNSLDLLRGRQDEKVHKQSSGRARRTQFVLKTIEGVDVFYSMPELDSEGERVRGIVLAFHGCTHTGLDWFQLPEEGVIVRKALAEHLAVVAFSSSDHESRCWSAADMDLVPRAYERFREAQPWARSLPVFLIGASSGGSFASLLPSKLEVKGLYVQIARPRSDILTNWVSPVPSTVHLLYMERDSRLKNMYEDYAKALHAAHGDVEKIRILQTGPCSLTVARLVERIYDMTETEAHRVLTILRERGVVDENGFPILRTIDQTVNFRNDDERVFFAVQEEVQVCYAAHELTSQHFSLVLSDWIASLK